MTTGTHTAGTQADGTAPAAAHTDGSTTIFPTGTFTPAPRASNPAAMLRSQTTLELKLILRHGEQLLLTLLIPVTMLVGLTLLPLGDFAEPRINHVLPLVLAVAIMSTAFTGQAIAVGFDRRYGALKRLGATALPKWAIIGGKSGAVGIVILGQMAILCTIALFLDWRPTLAGLAAGAVPVIVGALTFAAMGLLVGGRLKAEIVLALANILWFAMLGIAGLALLDHTLPAALDVLVTVIPSGALTQALAQAQSGTVALAQVAVLAAWAVVCGFLAVRTFRFE
ncbi:ABC transporter permease [Tomitella biformata]|uniref:ABC transporter permease n=1 Tax=Tomitella biformata TaxID=630403 RepID=UPI0004633A34|nr:ABC transporter permease [Tomitella biformata]